MITKMWRAYKANIYRNCIDENVDRTSMAYWQNKLFSASVMYLIPLSFIAIIPGIYMANQADMHGLIIVDTIAISTIVFVAFVPGMPVFQRKLIFNGVLYLTSTTLLLYLGSMGPGLLYLLGITIFIVLSLDKYYGYLAVAVNTIICIGVGIFLYSGWGNFEILSEYGLGSWIAVSSNLVFMSAVSVLLIPILFDGLQSALVRENKMKSKLEVEQQKLRKSNDDLNSKNEELEDFAYIISHDLKEPLRMISSFMELLEKKYSPQLDEKASRYIYFAVDGARRMTQSINNLLEYSRIGRLYVNSEELHVSEVMEDVTGILAGEIDNKGAKIHMDGLPVIKAVPVSMKMLFQNMISNAMKYQPKGQRPEIEIKASETSLYWQFSVSDNGIGIGEEFHQEIFGIFKRLHTRESYSGNGMGLAICKKIVEQHGGKIWVESQPGKGSTFYFTILKNGMNNHEA